MSAGTLTVEPADVEALLAGLASALAVQERLAGLVEDRTAALRRADAAAMAAADRAEAAALREGVALERDRRARTAALAAAAGLAPDAGLGEIAERLPAPARSRVLAAREALREAATANGRRAAAAARAAAATAAHVDALLRRVTAETTGGPRYAATGQFAPARASLSRWSLTA